MHRLALAPRWPRRSGIALMLSVSLFIVLPGSTFAQPALLLKVASHSWSEPKSNGKTSMQFLPCEDGKLADSFYNTGRRTALQLVALYLLCVTLGIGFSSFSSAVRSRRRNMVTQNIEKETLLGRIMKAGSGNYANLLEILDQGQADSAAVAATDGRTPLSYAALKSLVQDLDLAPYGVASKAVVATLMPAGDQAATLLIALLARYTAVPLSAALSVEEISEAVNLFGLEALLASPEHSQILRDRLPKELCLIEVVPDGNAAGVFTLHVVSEAALRSSTAKVTSGRLWHSDSNSISAPQNGPADNVLLLGTSGTTSRPKVVPITFQRLVLGAHVWSDAFGITEQDRALNMMPLYHVGGIITNVLALLVSGASVVCAPRLDEEKLLAWLVDFRITYYSAVPTMHQQVMRQLEDAKRICAAGVERIQLRAVATGAAHLPSAAALRLATVTGATVLQTYGMTECMPISIASNDFFSEEKLDGVGRPICDLSLRAPESGLPLSARNERGEVCVRGALVMPEYLSGGTASQHEDADGGGSWFRTGDLGLLDADGFLKLVGRTKEVINRGGELISPFEIEDAVLQFKGVQQCMAFSAPHTELGETVAVAVVADPTFLSSDHLTLSKLQVFLVAKLASVKLPEAIVFVREFPKGATGKVARIGFAEQIGLQTLSSATHAGDRAFLAERSGDGNWRLTGLPDCSKATLLATRDSLGLLSRVDAGKLQATRIFTCLYALASVAILVAHGLHRMAFQYMYWSNLMDDAPPLLLTLCIQPNWAMFFFSSGAAFSDRIGNETGSPALGMRDAVYAVIALLFAFTCPVTVGPLTDFLLRKTIGQGLHSADDCRIPGHSLPMWFFTSVLYFKLCLLILTKCRASPRIQVIAFVVLAGLRIPNPPYLPGAKENEWYLMGAMYLFAWHYGVDACSVLIKSAHSIESNYAFLWPRLAAFVLLLAGALAIRVPRLVRQCSGDRNIHLSGELTLHALPDTPGLLLAPVLFVYNLIPIAVSFFAFRGAPKGLQYLGNGALGTYILGSFMQNKLAMPSIDGAVIIPSLQLCASFAARIVPNNDSWFFSMTQWFSFVLWVFPFVLFAATLGRLHQEAFTYCIKLASQMLGLVTGIFRQRSPFASK